MSETPRTDALKQKLTRYVRDAWRSGFGGESPTGVDYIDEIALSEDAIDESVGQMERELSALNEALISRDRELAGMRENKWAERYRVLCAKINWCDWDCPKECSMTDVEGCSNYAEFGDAPCHHKLPPRDCEIASMRQERHQVRSELDATRRELEGVKAENAAMRERVKAAEASAAQWEAERAESLAICEREVAELREAKEKAERERDEARAESEAMLTTMENGAKEQASLIGQYQTAHEQMQATVAQTRSELTALRSENAAMRERAVSAESRELELRELVKQAERERDIEKALIEQLNRMMDAVSIVRELSKSGKPDESLASWVKRMCAYESENEAMRGAIGEAPAHVPHADGETPETDELMAGWAFQLTGIKANPMGVERYIKALADHARRLERGMNQARADAAYAWSRHAEKDMAYQVALDQRDALQSENEAMRGELDGVRASLISPPLINMKYTPQPAPVPPAEPRRMKGKDDLPRKMTPNDHGPFRHRKEHGENGGCETWGCQPVEGGAG